MLQGFVQQPRAVHQPCRPMQQAAPRVPRGRRVVLNSVTIPTMPIPGKQCTPQRWGFDSSSSCFQPCVAMSQPTLLQSPLSCLIWYRRS